jgi:hypothetical protein
MKKILVCLLLSLTWCSLIWAQEGPRSQEELRSKFEQALKAKDEEALKRLYCWDGIDDEDKAKAQKFYKSLLEQETDKVVLEPLSEDSKSEYVSNGILHKANLPLVGELVIHGKPSEGKTTDGKAIHYGPSKTHLHFGQKGESYYLVKFTKEVLPGIHKKDIPFNIIIWGNWVEPRDDKFEGHCVYDQAGKDNIEKFSGNGNGSYVFFGQTIKYCEVRKLTGAHPISLKIMEGGKIVFESPKINDQPIIYKKGKVKTHEAGPKPITYELRIAQYEDTYRKTPQYVYLFGDVAYRSLDGVKKFISIIPKGSIIEWRPGCMGPRPLSESEEDELKAFCETKGIKFVHVPSG